MAMTVFDLLADPELVAKAQGEFQSRGLGASRLPAKSALLGGVLRF